METIRLTGFMSRQWHHEIDGKKFRAQVYRRAAEMGGTVEIRDDGGAVLDVVQPSAPDGLTGDGPECFADRGAGTPNRAAALMSKSLEIATSSRFWWATYMGWLSRRTPDSERRSTSACDADYAIFESCFRARFGEGPSSGERAAFDESFFLGARDDLSAHIGVP